MDADNESRSGKGSQGNAKTLIFAFTSSLLFTAFLFFCFWLKRQHSTSAAAGEGRGQRRRDRTVQPPMDGAAISRPDDCHSILTLPVYSVEDKAISTPPEYQSLFTDSHVIPELPDDEDAPGRHRS